MQALLEKGVLESWVSPVWSWGEEVGYMWAHPLSHMDSLPCGKGPEGGGQE